MTLKSSGNVLRLPAAPSDKRAFIEFIERKLELQPACTVDLDQPAQIQSRPTLSQAGVWIDTWHFLADALGSAEDAREGVELARDYLYLASCRIDNLVFSADVKKPPLDQFGPPGRGLQMLFEASTCYTTVVPIATYRGRAVYWGNNPSVKWSDADCAKANVRIARVSSAGKLF